jgi:hypothetical protein
MFPPQAGESFHIVHTRSIAVVLLLALVAAAGVLAVRELTRPAPLQPVPTIDVDTGSGKQAGETPEDEQTDRKQRRRKERERREGSSRPAADPPAAQERSAPDPPPPQQPAPDTQPELAPVPPSDDGGDD